MRTRNMEEHESDEMETFPLLSDSPPNQKMDFSSISAKKATTRRRSITVPTPASRKSNRLRKAAPELGPEALDEVRKVRSTKKSTMVKKPSMDNMVESPKKPCALNFTSEKHGSSNHYSTPITVSPTTPKKSKFDDTIAPRSTASCDDTASVCSDDTMSEGAATKSDTITVDNTQGDKSTPTNSAGRTVLAVIATVFLVATVVFLFSSDAPKALSCFITDMTDAVCAFNEEFYGAVPTHPAEPISITMDAE